MQPQNLTARLQAAGKDIVEKSEIAANQLAGTLDKSGKITVGGVASAVEGSIAEFKGATVDMANSIN
jgi:hypothetical protein